MLRTAAALLALSLFVTPAHAAPADPPIPADVGETVTTASGLKYCVLKAGQPSGAPRKGDSVRVHYTGWFPEGQVFDSSRTRGEPAVFPVGGVIEGWNEALVLMTPGANWKLTIPASLGYGNQDIPGIPKGSTLIFDVELLVVLPRMRPADPAKQTSTPSGMKVEVLAPGEGDLLGANQIAALSYALWTPEGRLVMCTDDSAWQFKTGPEKLPILFKGVPEKLPVRFLEEITKTMRPHGRVRVEVPAELAFGAGAFRPPLPDAVTVPPNSTTIWELELVEVKPLVMPAFAASAQGKAIKTDSGLEIEMLEEGSGPSPRMNELVTVNYAGWLMDGKLFDSSYQRDSSMSFMIGQVIRGWNEGLQLMKAGGKARLTIPAALAYGAAGSGKLIGPNQPLIFYIELLKIGR